MEKKLKINLLVCVSAFIAVFTALLIVASFYDLQISRALTSGSLGKGEYYSTNDFAVFFEIVGFSVFYLSGGISSLICVAAAIRMQDGEKFFFIKELKGIAYKIVKWTLIVGFSAFAVYEMYNVFREPFKYADKYIQDAVFGTGAVFTLKTPYMVAVEVLMGLVVSGLVLALLLKLNREAIFKLVKIAVILFLVELLYLAVIGAVKDPIGRMRFRTMNAIDNFSYYTPWYVINGARHVLPNGTVVTGNVDTSMLVGAASDTCKSFPSGHTYGAAMSFALVCLPDLFDKFKKPFIKAVCWIIPVWYTVTVALCRIIVGAHFFSDVLVGGTLAFTLVMIFREIIILNLAHFKAFKRTE